MDKKQNRSVQAPNKGVGTELKKTQDVTNGKFWPRGSRKREPNGSSFPSKNEVSRKPAPQRNKSLDKRPKPRGGYYASTSSGKEDTGLAEHDAELGSVFIPGSKKQSLNHLLNFHYTPRGDTWTPGSSPLSRSGSGPHRWLSTQKHKYNKEQFLQANCQFVVDSEGNYKQYMNNPDALVDWGLVEQIHVQVSEFPSCPICLYPPVAAKMTRCGHVYCWSCILHYLALSDKTWRKCPICHESVHKNDLKSAVAIPHNAFNVNEYITLRLMKRAQGSLTAMPVDEANISRNPLLYISEKSVDTVYSKLLLANSFEVMSIIDRERNELTAQLKDEDNSPEKCFIEQAINHLSEREKVVFGKLKKSNDNHLKSPTNMTRNVATENHHKVNRVRFESVSSEGLSSEECSSISMVEAEISSSASNDNNSDIVKNYYFYQAADGQHIYLHALNIRMLEYTYGSLDQCPRTITGRIVEKEGGSMTEELRKRLRYLQHLPVTCQFEVAEIQLRPPLISKETLDNFQDQIETRKKRRQRRARDEKRREKRIEAEENRRLGRAPEVNVHIESLHQFPQFGAEEPSSSSTVALDTGIATPNSDRSHSPSLVGSIATEEQYSGPSFATMLATGKSKPPSWPELRSPLKQEAPTPRLINVTGSQSTSSSSTRCTRNTHIDSDPEPEDYVPVPAFNQSFSDAIALALEKAAISTKDVDVGGTCGTGSSSKKKKKSKQKVLFATSMVYSGK